MPKLVRLRTLAFHAQSGLCYYCSRPMWLVCPSELGLRPRSAAPYQCTAEHLLARQDGGRDVDGNVVAACWLCNQRRHKRKKPPTPEAYKALVQRQVAKGKWWPAHIKLSEVTDAERRRSLDSDSTTRNQVQSFKHPDQFALKPSD